jgi:hypothetical protein
LQIINVHLEMVFTLGYFAKLTKVRSQHWTN